MLFVKWNRPKIWKGKIISVIPYLLKVTHTVPLLHADIIFDAIRERWMLVSNQPFYSLYNYGKVAVLSQEIFNWWRKKAAREQ